MYRPRSLVVASLALVLGSASLFAGDLRIPLPKRSKYTPVQKLNRDGVAAVEKHQYDKAKRLFYEAYLIDPNDPFTLNNLGYMAELDGDTDRAQRYYQLSSEVSSDAVVDKATNELVEGKPVSVVAGNAEEKGIKINRLNGEAIALLNKERAPEADLILQKALTLDSKNPFTLNNLGYAKEKEGEIEAAYQFYTAAANMNSRERIELAAYSGWRGRAISDVARINANKLRKYMRDGSLESRVARLNLRGVSAMNRNDRRAARELIQQAYKLAPTDAFTLNNMGYLAELDGDRETANHFYGRAQEANRANAKVAMATRKDVEGMRIGELAVNSDAAVAQRMAAAQAARQRMGGPVLLRRRADNSLIVEPDNPVARPQVRVSDANGVLLLPPRPATSDTPSSGGGLAMPLPDSQQPVTVRQGENDGGLIMPLPEPENDQPDNTGGQNNGGLMMPLPDDRQPEAVQPQNPGAIGQPTDSQSPTQPITPQVQNMPPVQQDQAPTTQAAPAQPTPALTTRPATNQRPIQVPQAQQGAQQNVPAEQGAGPGMLLPRPDQRQQSPPPSQAAPQQQAPSQGPGLLLPPPDSQQQNQPPPAQTQSTPQPGNVGVYTPPPANRNAPPKRISDKDPRPTQNSNVKKIDDRD